MDEINLNRTEVAGNDNMIQCDNNELQGAGSANSNANGQPIQVPPKENTGGTSECESSQKQTEPPVKMRIDPLQLLNCLSILLNSKGAIKSIDEVQRVAGLMGKYSKKLVSKCIYLNILNATEEPLLDEFYKETGWNLVCAWLTEASSTKNYPLAQQILSLLLVSPITIERLKRNNMPKMVKDLSKDCPHAGARLTAERVVQRWKDIVKGCVVSEGSGSFASSDLTLLNSSLESNFNNTLDSISLLASSKSSSLVPTVGIPMSNVTTPFVSSAKYPVLSSIASSDEVVNQVNKSSIPSEQEIKTDFSSSILEIPPALPVTKPGRRRGVPKAPRGGAGRGRGRRKRGGSRGRGHSALSYAELLCQDIESQDSLPKLEENDDEMDDEDEVKGVRMSGPPIRITIRNGSKVLAEVSSRGSVSKRGKGNKKQRVSIDSTDSDDNKPLSLIKEECQSKTTSLITDDEDNDEEVKPKKKRVTKRIIDEGSDEEENEPAKSINNNSGAISDTPSELESKPLKEKKQQPKTKKVIKTKSKEKDEKLIEKKNLDGDKKTKEVGGDKKLKEDDGDKKLKEDVDKKLKEDVDKKLKEDVDTKLKEDSDTKLKEDGDKKLKEDGDKKLKEGEKKLKEDEDKKLKEDGDKKLKEHGPGDKKLKEENNKEKLKDEKHREKENDRKKDKKEKDNSSSKSHEKDQHKERDKSKHDKERHRSRDIDKQREKERDREKRDKRSNSNISSSSNSRDKDKGRDVGREKLDKERRRDSDDKDYKKEQAEKDKATLDKVKPLSTEGLAKIPRKTSSVKPLPPTSVSFLDALGSADSDVSEGKRPVVKAKSRSFRNTGLLDETVIKPPGIAGKRSTDAKLPKSPPPLPPAIKRQNSGVLDAVSQLEKKPKTIPSSLSFAADRPGGVKLISPKRPTLSDDGGFMAALTAAGPDRKKIARKRKSSEGDSKPEGTSKTPKTEAGKDLSDEGQRSEDEFASPLKYNSEEVVDEGSEISKEKSPSEEVLLSPTSIKPTLNFYKETLLDEPEKKDTEESAKVDNDDIDEEEPPAEKEEESTAIEDSPSEEKAPEAIDAKKDDDSMEIDESDENGKDEGSNIELGFGNGDAGPFSGDDGLTSSGGEGDKNRAPVPAPAQEEYEKIEVTFSKPSENLKSALVYHHSLNKRKKAVKWKPDDDLKETFFFPMDETERVNVNIIKFNEMMMMEKAREKELMLGKHKNAFAGRYMPDGFTCMENGMPNTCIDYGPYKLYPVHLPNPPTVVPGYKSIEKHVQAQREHSTMAAFFHPAMLPDTPTEPDPEMVQRSEPVVIPLVDVTGSDSICDNRGIPWPEPLFNPPEYPYMGGSGPPPGPPPSSGGHWVLGNHSVSRFGGAPMFGGPNGPPGPVGNPGGFPPQNYHGDMRGGGWGGPSDFGGPPVMMPSGPNMLGGGGHGMGGPAVMQGGPNMSGGGPGMGMGMRGGPSMGSGNGYQRYRRGGGGNWGGSQTSKIHCKHYRFGNCKNGTYCNFLHVPP